MVKQGDLKSICICIIYYQPVIKKFEKIYFLLPYSEHLHILRTDIPQKIKPHFIRKMSSLAGHHS